MRFSSGAAALLLSTTICGCTSLSTSSEVRTVASEDAVTGMPYSLPILQYEVKVTRTLSQCTEKVTVGGMEKEVPSLKFLMKAEASPVFVAGERYTMDYQKLAGFTKVSSVSVDFYPSGTLKSINASAEDRSAAILSNVAKTALGVARIASGIPTGSAAEGATVKNMLICAPDTPKLLEAVKTATANLKTETEALGKITARIAVLTEQAKANALDEKGKAELLEKIQAQTEAAKKVAEAQSTVEKANAAVSVVTGQRVPQTFTQKTGYLVLAGPELMKFTKLVVQIDWADNANGEDNRCDKTEIRDCLADKLQAVWLLESLTRLASGTIATAEQGAIKTNVAQKGVFVRTPEPGRMLICKWEPGQPCASTAKGMLLTTPDAMVPQLGQLRFFPFQNKGFQSNSIALTLRENGSIDKFEYKDLKAQGEAISGALADLVGQAGSFADARRKARLDEETAAAASAKTDRETEIALLQFEIDRLTKQKQIDTLNDTQIVVLQQEIDRITKEKELEKLNQPATVSELATVKAEEELARAREALYKALRAEREAQKALQEG